LKTYKFLLIILFLLPRCATTGSERLPTPAKDGPQGPITALIPAGIIGEAVLGSSFLSHPTGIALDSEGNLFIADTGNDRVVKCAGDGRFIRETGGYGWEEGQFNRPSYVACDHGLNVYVSDAQNRRVQRFDRNLNFVSTIRVEATDDFSGFGLLEGIAVAPGGELLLCDVEDDHVVKLDILYAYGRTLGGFGYGQGSLRDPLGICVDQRERVYVADSENDRVVIYDLFGNYIKSLGEAVLRRPAGVAAGEDGSVYVANTEKNSIAIFDSKGNLVLEYGTQGAGMGNLSKPTDLKLGRDDRLFVVDSGNSRICIFQILRQSSE
jgi:tripartite motif-containing protein 71